MEKKKPIRQVYSEQSRTAQGKVLRVGFDLDGVILYNPLRIGRPLVVLGKKYIKKKDEDKFYIPTNSLERYLLYLLHKSSLFPAPGVKLLKQMVRKGKIEAYIISGRYGFVKGDLEYWLARINASLIFKAWYTNDGNEQPPIFKSRMIEKLKLDVFIEDNWDIVAHLRDKFQVSNPKFQVFWITNILDRHIEYKYKFSSLHEALEALADNHLRT